MLCSLLLEVKAKIGGDFCGVKFIHELGVFGGPRVMGRKGMELLSSLVVFPALAAQGAGVSQKIMSFFPCTTNSCPSAPTLRPHVQLNVQPSAAAGSFPASQLVALLAGGLRDAAHFPTYPQKHHQSSALRRGKGRAASGSHG